MSKRVLLVEDEGLIRLTLAETLEDAGYTVVAAGTGDEACALLGGKGRFDVLLTDIQMPGDARRDRRRAQFQPTPSEQSVVFMTGRPDMLSRVGRLSKSEALLRKPFGAAQMLTALAALLVSR